MLIWVRFQIIRTALTENVGNYQSWMVSSKSRIIWKRATRACVLLFLEDIAAFRKVRGERHYCKGLFWSHYRIYLESHPRGPCHAHHSLTRPLTRITHIRLFCNISARLAVLRFLM